MANNNQHPVVRKDGRGDTLSKLMHDLCHRLPTAAKVGETTLSMHVSAEARDLSGESLSRYMNDLYGRIFSMMSRYDVSSSPRIIFNGFSPVPRTASIRAQI